MCDGCILAEYLMFEGVDIYISKATFHPEPNIVNYTVSDFQGGNKI
jgi:hypothetical protein